MSALTILGNLKERHIKNLSKNWLNCDTKEHHKMLFWTYFIVFLLWDVKGSAVMFLFWEQWTTLNNYLIVFPLNSEALFSFGVFPFPVLYFRNYILNCNGFLCLTNFFQKRLKSCIFVLFCMSNIVKKWCCWYCEIRLYWEGFLHMPALCLKTRRNCPYFCIAMWKWMHTLWKLFIFFNIFFIRAVPTDERYILEIVYSQFKVTKMQYPTYGK